MYKLKLTFILIEMLSLYLYSFPCSSIFFTSLNKIKNITNIRTCKPLALLVGMYGRGNVLNVIDILTVWPVTVMQCKIEILNLEFVHGRVRTLLVEFQHQIAKFSGECKIQLNFGDITER